MNHLKVLLPVLLLTANMALAQDENVEAGESPDANDPLASFTAFNIQNYYVPEITGTDDTTANNMQFK